ncbi:MAG: hypothetical protein J6Q54_01340 [Oscillospiraceae bacterium]|nr:hypothetical protein [Oscillospiraceae bacterium]
MNYLQLPAISADSVFIAIFWILLIGFFVGLTLAVAKPKWTNIITFIFGCIAFVFGCSIHVHVFLQENSDNVFFVGIRAFLSTCSMFLGENNYNDVQSGLPVNTWCHALFWITYGYAIFTTISAVFTTLGKQLLQKLRLWLGLHKRICLVYGINGNTMKLGQEMAKQKGSLLVYVAEQAEPADKEAIEELGGLVRTDDQALEGTESFLKSIGCNKNRHITLYALMEDPSVNFHYAERLLASLKAKDISCTNTHLVIRAHEQSAMEKLQVKGKKYGYGYVAAFDGASLAARMLTREYPPCNYLDFDEDGKAKENFEVLIVGFGQVGQAVLKNLIMFGQFEGSQFRATVFAPDCLEASGSFSRQFDALQQQYHIELIPGNAKSGALYDFLKKQGKRLKYVAICAGSEKMNQELVEDVATYCRWLQLDMPVFTCSQRSVKFWKDGFVESGHSLYQVELLSAEKLDRRAMLLNAQYENNPDKTPEELWMDCPFFSRQSNRAAADYFQTYLKATDKTAEEVCTNGWKLTEKQKEVMGRHEHLRWWAFHACMGYRVMDKKTIDVRGQEFLAGKLKRITKDDVLQLHACMVPWEELPQVAQWEGAYTGKVKDYQIMDVNNVMMVPDLLRQEEK